MPYTIGRFVGFDMLLKLGKSRNVHKNSLLMIHYFSKAKHKESKSRSLRLSSCSFLLLFVRWYLMGGNYLRNLKVCTTIRDPRPSRRPNSGVSAPPPLPLARRRRRQRPPAAPAFGVAPAVWPCSWLAPSTNRPPKVTC